MGRLIAGVTISHPDKLLFPAARFTKADLVSYYVGVAPYLLPHLRGRPVTLKRYPDGAGGTSFWEKGRRCRSPSPAPSRRRRASREIEGRRGSAGVPRASGVWGPCRGAHVVDRRGPQAARRSRISRAASSTDSARRARCGAAAAMPAPSAETHAPPA